jgi:zinc protease
MHKFFKVFLFFVLLNLSVICFAADLDKPVSVFRLKNGQTVVIKEVHANPVVTISTWVKTGSAMETEKNNGISHFLEHLMFKGTNKHPAGEFQKILEEKGARCNAATSKDFTFYYITVASKFVDTALALHADLMLNPVIPQEEMDKERKVVQEEIRRSDDSPMRTLSGNLFSMIFSKHPYKMEILGTMENIENVSRDEVLGYYRERYAPSNLVTVIVGDVNTQAMLEKVRAEFQEASNTENKKVDFKLPVQPDLSKPAEKIEKGDYETGYILFGFKGVPITNIKEGYALDMAAQILGGSESSRLYQTLKQDKNLVNSINASHYSLKDDSVFLVLADFDPKKYEKVRAEIIKEIEKFRENPVTKEELERAKTLARRRFIYSNESVENIAESIGYCMTTQGNIDCYNKHLKYIDDVKPYDIQNAVKKYISLDKYAMSVLLPEETPVNITKPAMETIKDSSRSVLNNGSVLITTKITSNDIIAMNVFFKGGKFLEKKPGLASLLSTNLLYGTKNRPYKQLIKEIENLGVSIDAYANNDYVKISLKSTKEDFDRAYEILADIIKNPAFEEKYIQKNKEDILAGIKKSRDVPLNVASEKFFTTLYKNHPYGHTGAVVEKSMPTITVKDVTDFWSQTFIPENMIVSAAGDINHQELADKLAQIFPSSGKAPPAMECAKDTSSRIKLEQNNIVKTNSNSNAASILMGWSVGNIRDDKEMATFKVINALLSGGLSSRLHNTFREKQGLAYSVGASYSASLDGGHFVLYIGTAPQNVELVKAKFLEEVDRLKTQPLTQAELEGIKSKVIGNYEIAQETNESKASIIGNFEVVDKKFGFNYDFPDLISKVTAEDIIRTANKYFNAPYVLSIVAPSGEK